MHGEEKDSLKPPSVESRTKPGYTASDVIHPNEVESISWLKGTQLVLSVVLLFLVYFLAQYDKYVLLPPSCLWHELTFRLDRLADS